MDPIAKATWNVDDCEWQGYIFQESDGNFSAFVPIGNDWGYRATGATPQEACGVIDEYLNPCKLMPCMCHKHAKETSNEP